MIDQNHKLHKVFIKDGKRYVFQKASGLRDQSFTLSYDLESSSWVFFHDYIPDYYFSTRRQLFTLNNNSLWLHNSSTRGSFYDKDVKNSFYIDMVFSFEEEVFLNSVQFLTKMLGDVSSITDWKSITHLTIWNDNQCTGRIPIDTLKNFVTGASKSRSEYSINEFRDMVKSDVVDFLGDIFNDFRPLQGAIDNNKPWYEQSYLQDRYFIVRLEYDNQVDSEVSIHEVSATVEPTI